MHARTNRSLSSIFLLLAVLMQVSCGESGAPAPGPDEATSVTPETSQPAGQQDTVAAPAAASPGREAYFGAVHVHANNSFDAFTNGTVTTPADAYTWAQGGVIDGGSAESVFTEMMDAHLASVAAVRQGKGLGEALFRQLSTLLPATGPAAGAEGET